MMRPTTLPKYQIIFLHLAFWAFVLALPFLLAPSQMPPAPKVQFDKGLTVTQFFAFCAFINIPFFYINSEVLIPKIFQKKGIWAYLLAAVGLIVLIFLFNTLITFLFFKNQYVPRTGPTFQLLFFLAISTAYRLISNNLKNEQEKKEQETEKLKSELSFLRSQISPHFIFNVLNSINKYILVNEGAKASHYLTQFSRLIRQVLENSKSSKVTLESDLQALQLYINMEKLRFEERFTCNIEIDKNIDQQFTQLPPLLIQPYAENAIWHGLMQKETPGHLEIIITQPQENTLQIIIKDNGIGRKKAVVLQSKSATIHKSFGMQITKDRIDIVNKIFSMQATVEYEDLYKDGKAAGTSVTLIIPV